MPLAVGPSLPWMPPVTVLSPPVMPPLTGYSRLQPRGHFGSAAWQRMASVERP